MPTSAWEPDTCCTEQIMFNESRPDWWLGQHLIEERMAKIGQMLESKYLKGSDVEHETVVTIVKVGQGNIAKPGDDPELKWMVRFEELSKPMILNATNIKRLAKACGSEDTDDWTGKKVVVYFDPDIEFAGNVVGGLRIKAYKAAPEVKRVPGKPGTALDDLDSDVPFLYNTSTVFNAMLTAPSTSWERAKHGKENVQDVRKAKAALGVLPAQDDGRWASK